MNYAHWGSRVGAALIDGLVVLPFSILAFVFSGMGTDAETGQVSGPGPLYYVFLLLGLLVSAYNRWYLTGKTGQSWGKKALGISLIDEAGGQPIGMGKAFVRELAHFVDGIICYIGYLFPLWDAKKQTIADKIMKTVVVSA
ncbi:RDD family protein [Plantactinospora soyae]|uniref:RDD family membrane protein YckC n=1 Tax=Plantactinospora soyae TaxID=1544732 RepID=A0A927M4D6_9ACTN|nr:RDD family protein [Plantactinospora soyae]MBE1486426.1 putative RDD family membrane protein YckC [Plantactinospora soyae]